MTEEDNFLIDSENYRAGEENKFNHQVLVMKAMQKCLDLGSVEMVEGYWDTKLDKNGNAAKTYHPDTRRAFIESVKSLMMVTEPDYSSKLTTTYKLTIEECLKLIEKRKQYWQGLGIWIRNMCLFCLPRGSYGSPLSPLLWRKHLPGGLRGTMPAQMSKRWRTQLKSHLRKD